MADVLMHPAMRRPTPMLNTEPLPDEAVPSIVIADVMARIVKDFSLLTMVMGKDAVRIHAPLLAEEGIEGAR